MPRRYLIFAYSKGKEGISSSFSERLFASVFASITRALFLIATTSNNAYIAPNPPPTPASHGSLIIMPTNTIAKNTVSISTNLPTRRQYIFSWVFAFFPFAEKLYPGIKTEHFPQSKSMPKIMHSNTKTPGIIAKYISPSILKNITLAA